MSFDDALSRILSKYPDLVPISEAIRQYFKDEPVTTRCLKCNGLLKVKVVKAVDTVWVTCPNGCTSYHENYKPGALSDK